YFPFTSFLILLPEKNLTADPSNDTAEEVKGWSVGKVKKWAEKLSNVQPEDTVILEKQRVDGRTLLSLTEEKLQSIGIPLGPAHIIAEEIKKWTAPPQGKRLWF